MANLDEAGMVRRSTAKSTFLVAADYMPKEIRGIDDSATVYTFFSNH